MSKVRALIVDDAIFMRNMIIDSLPQDRYQIVAEAANGNEAVQKYREYKPNITIMDLTMPFKSGVDATKEILKLDNNALIIVYGGLGDETELLKAIEAGATDFFMKPFEGEAVAELIEKALSARKPSRDSVLREVQEVSKPSRKELLRKVQRVAQDMIKRIAYCRGYLKTGQTNVAKAHMTDIIEEAVLMKQALADLEDQTTGGVIEHLEGVIQEILNKPEIAQQHIVNANKGLLDLLMHS